MAKKKDISVPERNTITPEDLKRYEAGEMTFQEMYRVEKLLLEQPFYADAAEGISELKKDKVSVDKNLNDLKARLGNRINTSTDKPTPALRITRIWKPVSIAAALLMVFAGTYYIIDYKQQDNNSTIILKNQDKTDDLSEPIAQAPIAKEDHTTLSKTRIPTEPKVIEKKQTESINQAQAVLRETAAPPLSVEETEAKEVESSVITERIAETPTLAPEPLVLQKKSGAEIDEISPESRTLGGAARMARATISGKVVDEENQPMKDVTVNIKGKADGIRTDEEGRFSLRDARKGDIIVFNNLTMPQMEVPLKNVLPGKIVYSEDNIKLAGKPKVSVSSPHDAMLGKAATDARPEFGWEAFEVYLKENTKRPPKALQSNIQGRVIVSFTVNEKGELSDFSIIRSLGFGCDEEAIRIIKNGPKWFPATKEDKPVLSSNEVVVRFR